VAAPAGEPAHLADWRPGETTRDLAIRRALAGTHLLLAADGAGFVSLADPPAGAAAAAAGCRNAGWWPALVGGAVLVAPIILPDQAEIAPESPVTCSTRPRSTRSSRCG